MPTIHECTLVQLPRIWNRKGNITVAENFANIPFEIRRVYYLYDIPGGAKRGGHAHKALQQLIVAAMGAFDVVLNDGFQTKTVRLDRAYYGLYIPRMIWRELENFSSGSISLVLASLAYDESDYFREYSDFLQAVEGQGR